MRKPRIDKFTFYDLVIYAARGSHSARRLATSLGCRRWRDDLPNRYTRRRPFFRGNKSPMVVNWGSTVPADWLRDPRFRLTPMWLNSAEAVNRAIDKLAFFRCVADSKIEIPTIAFTEDREQATKWLKKDFGVVARRTTTGSGGAGIVVVRPGDGIDALPKAPLYTRYYPKTHEFRCHVWKDRCIDFTQKMLRGGPNAGANRTIRNLDNGWIHAHNGIVVGEADIQAMGSASISCIKCLGLDFGAVDVLAILDNDRQLKSFKICEVNTGPGLENAETIQAYKEAILFTKQGQ